MDWDDEFNNWHDEMVNSLQQKEIIQDKGPSGGFDPMDITNPASVYFFSKR